MSESALKNTAKKLSCLVVDDEDEIREFIGFYLDSIMDFQVEYCSSGNEVIRLIKANPTKYTFIICDYNMPDGNGGTVYKYIQDYAIQLPFILCSSENISKHPEFKTGSLYGHIEKPFIREPLIKLVSELLESLKSNQHLKIAKELPLETEPQSFVWPMENTDSLQKIKIKLLKRLTPLPCDVFIKLASQKVIKLYNKNDVFSDLDEHKYKSKNVEFLFVERSNLMKIYEVIENSILSAFQLRKDDPFGQVIEYSLQIEHDIQDICCRIGFTPELELMAKNTVNLVVKIASYNPSLEQMLKPFLSRDKNSEVSKGLLLSYICIWICHRMTWTSDQTSLKLSLAAFLHDSTLKNQKLNSINSMEELDAIKSELSEEEYKSWLYHSVDAAQIVSLFSEIPPGVDTIILQHHETPDGKGFPDKITHGRIAPLSAVFIVGLKLMDFILNRPNQEFDPKGFALKYADLYNLGNFKKILREIHGS